MKNLMGIMEQSIQQFRESNDRFIALSSLVKEHVVEEKNQEIKDLYENLQYKDKNIQELKEKLAKKEQEIQNLKKKQKNTGKNRSCFQGNKSGIGRKKHTNSGRAAKK